MAWVWSHKRINESWKFLLHVKKKKIKSAFRSHSRRNCRFSCLCSRLRVLWLANGEQKGVSNATIAKRSAPGLGVIFPLHCTSVSVKTKQTECFCKKGVELTLCKAAVSPPSRVQHASVQAHLLQPAGASRDQPLPLCLFGHEVWRPQDRSSRLAQNQAKWVARVPVAKTPLEMLAKEKQLVRHLCVLWAEIHLTSGFS